MKSLLAATVILASAHPALANDFSVGDLTIAHPMAFETAKTAKTGGGYLSVTNNGTEADALVGVKADFPRVMIHNTEEKDGVAKMFHVDAVEIPAGETVELAPGGYHVMFMGLDGDPFEIGEKIPATLTFEKAGDVDISFTVEPRNAASKDKEMDHNDHEAATN